MKVLVLLLHVYAQESDGTERLLRFSNANVRVDGARYMQALDDLDEWAITETGYDVRDGLVLPRGAIIPEIDAVDLSNPVDVRSGRGRLDDVLDELDFKGVRYELLWARVGGSPSLSLSDFAPLQSGTVRKEPTPGDEVKLELDPQLGKLRHDFKQPRLAGLGGMHWQSPTSDSEVVTVAQELLPTDAGDERTLSLWIDMPLPSSHGILIELPSDTPGQPALRLRVGGLDLDEKTWQLSLLAYRDDGTVDVSWALVTAEADFPLTLTLVMSKERDLRATWINGELIASNASGQTGEARTIGGDLKLGGSAERTWGLGYLRWWSRALTDDEIRAIDGKPLDPVRWKADLVLAFECGERYGSILTDESPHGRHGVRSGYADDLVGWGSTRTGEADQHGDVFPVLLGRGHSLPLVPLDLKLGYWTVSGGGVGLVRFLYAGGVPLARELEESANWTFVSETLTLRPEVFAFASAAGSLSSEVGHQWVPEQWVDYLSSSGGANEGTFRLARLVPDPHFQDRRPLSGELRVYGPVTWTDGQFSGTLKSTSPLWSIDDDDVVRYESSGAVLSADAWGDPRAFASMFEPPEPFPAETAANVVGLILDGGYSSLTDRVAPIWIDTLPEPVGVYVGERKTVGAVIEEVLVSSRGLLLELSDGTLDVRRWQLPDESSDTPVDIPAGAIDSVEPLDPVETADALLVGYAHAHVTLDDGQIAPSAPVWSRAYHRSPWRWVTYPSEAADVATSPRVETALMRQADAKSLAAWLHRLARGRFYRLRVRAPLERQHLYPVGGLVRPTWRRWLTGSPTAVVFERRRHPFGGVVVLVVLVVKEEV